MTDIQPGQRFTLYNGSGTWGHFDCEVLVVGIDGGVHYRLREPGGDWTKDWCSDEYFQKLINDGYVEMKE